MADQEKKQKKALIGGIIAASLGGATLAAGIPVIVINSGKTTPVNYYTVTFDANSSEAKFSGGMEVKLSEEMTFGKINKPTVATEPAGKVFDCWTSDPEGNNPISESTVIKTNTTVYAKWANKTTESTLTFTTGGEADVTIKGAESVIIKSTQMFGEINVPVATKTSKDPSKSYVFDYWTTTQGSDVGKIIDSTKFTSSKNVYPMFKEVAEEEYVHLTFQPKEEESSDFTITFNGSSKCRISLSNQLTFGECNKPDVSKTRVVGGYTLNYPFLNKWVYKDASGEYKEVTDGATFTAEENYVYPVFSDEPTFLESQYYVKMDGELGAIVNNTESIGDQIEIKFADEQSKFIDKDKFNERVYIGSKITSISPNFLRGCTAYNQKIELPSNVTFIGSGFLFGATSFNNGGEDFTIPETITSIGNCFLYGCTSFNQKLDLSAGLELIGDYFLFYCSAFNQSIVLPSTLKSIGNSFLSNCLKFNTAFNIPNNVEYIGSGFLEECGAFTKDIDLSNTKVTEIKDSFLYNSTNYTGQVTLPAGLTKIGDNFMAWITSGSFKQVDFTKCTQLASIGNAFFNNSQNYNKAIDLSACTQLKSIGSNVLRTTNYNSTLTLPNGLESIGNYFLYGASSFNQNLTIPSSVTSIGDYFMYACSSYTGGTLTINCSLDAWTEPGFCFFRSDGWGTQRQYKVNYTQGLLSDVTTKFPDTNPPSGTNYHRRFTQG